MTDNSLDFNQPSAKKENIPCRLCSQVFPSVQSFIAHLESHMAQDKNAIIKLSHGNPLLKPNFPIQETRNNMAFEAPPPSPMVLPQPITCQFPYANNMQTVGIGNYVAGLMEVSPIDGTRPYIDMLDKPIHYSNVSSVNGDMLNLALRL